MDEIGNENSYRLRRFQLEKQKLFPTVKNFLSIFGKIKDTNYQGEDSDFLFIKFKTA